MEIHMIDILEWVVAIALLVGASVAIGAFFVVVVDVCFDHGRMVRKVLSKALHRMPARIRRLNEQRSGA
jgi:hypothetical protein